MLLKLFALVALALTFENALVLLPPPRWWGVFGVAWGKCMLPVTLIMPGLVVSLYSSAANGLLALFHYEYLQNLFLWSSVSLNQRDCQVAAGLLPRVIPAWFLALLLLRPMTLLGVDDGVARNLVLGLSLARLAALFYWLSYLSTVLVNAVSIVGFVGLFSPLLARLSGARWLLHRLFLAPLIGALLLWLTDQNGGYDWPASGTRSPAAQLPR